MKRFLVIGIIVILVILTLIVLAIKRTENNSVVDNATNSVSESAIENDANTTDGVVSDNGDVDTYGTILLDDDIYDKNGIWVSKDFEIPDTAVDGINFYYQNDSKHDTIIEFYNVSSWGNDKEIYNFIVSPGNRIVHNRILERGASYYIRVTSIYGGSVEGYIRVAVK